MAFIRTKKVGGRPYYYLVECRRDGPGGSPRQHVLEYVGTVDGLRDLARAGRGDLSDAAARRLAKDAPEEAAGEPPASEDDGRDAGPTWTPTGATADGGPYFTCYEYGAPAALWKVVDHLGLERILDECLPAKTVKGMPRSRVLALECVRHAVDPGSKRAFAGWCGRTSLPHHLGFAAADLDSQAMWEAMDGIAEGQIDAVQRALVARLRELFPEDLDNLQLDYTNYHTWIDTRNDRCIICRRGHNKQKRSDLRQFSIAMLTSEPLPVPLVWDLYEGNKNDKSEFPDFVAKVEREWRGDLGEVTVSFDGGGNSAEALASLPFNFVCAHSLAGLKGLYDVPAGEYVTVDIGGGRTRVAHRVDGLTFSGVTGTGVLTLSEDLRRGQEAELEAKERALEKKRDDIMERFKKPRSSLFTNLRKEREAAERKRLEVRGHNAEVEERRAAGEAGGRRRPAPKPFDEVEAMGRIVNGELFKGRACLKGFWSAEVTREDGEWSLELTRDDEARAAYIDGTFGKKLTVTNRTDWSTEEILAAYADQEAVEDLFRTTKRTDHFSMRPQYHWTDDKIRVHVLLCLCSVTLAEVLRRLVAEAGVSMSKPALIDALSRVHDGWVFDGREVTWATERVRGREARVWKAALAVPGALPGAT